MFWSVLNYVLFSIFLNMVEFGVLLPCGIGMKSMTQKVRFTYLTDHQNILVGLFSFLVALARILAPDHVEGRCEVGVQLQKLYLFVGIPLFWVMLIADTFEWENAVVEMIMIMVSKVNVLENCLLLLCIILIATTLLSILLK